MPVATRIQHVTKNRVWVRPNICCDTWEMINDYARQHKTDFPSASYEAAQKLNVTDSANVNAVGAVKARRKVENQVMVRPEISYDAWKLIDAYARRYKTDFPFAMHEAAKLLIV